MRFGGVRAPVRLRVDVQRIDRDAAVSVAREGAGSPRVIARVKRDAHRRDRVLPADPRGRRVRLRAGLRVDRRAGAARARGCPCSRARSPRGRRRSRSAWRSSCCCRRAATSARPTTTRTARTSRARCGRSSRPSRAPACSTEELDAQIVGLARLVMAPARARAARRTPADHRRLGPAQQPAGGAGAAAHRARVAAVLRRRPHRPRDAARGPADQRHPARRDAAGVRDRQPRLRRRGAGAGRRRRDRAHRARPAAAAAGASGRWSCASPACGSPATAIRSAAAARADTCSRAPCPAP